MPTRARLREAFDYDPETGLLRWRIHLGNVAAGRIAGGTDREGRRVVTIDGEDYFASRLIWKWVTGREPRGIIGTGIARMIGSTICATSPYRRTPQTKLSASAR